MSESTAPGRRFLPRVHRRTEADISIECELSDGTRTLGTIKDISLGGAFIVVDEPLGFGSKLTVRLQLPGLATLAQLPAVVRWTDREGAGLQWGLLGARETHGLTRLIAELDRRQRK